MPQIPLSTKIYVFIICLATVGVFIWKAPTIPDLIESIDLQLAVIIVILLVSVEKFKLELPQSTFHLYLSVGSILTLAVCMIFPPIIAMPVVMLSIAIDDIWERVPPIQSLSNVCVLGLSAFSAASVYIVLAHESETPLASLRNMGASVAASAAYVLVNSTLLSIVVAPVVQESAFKLWRKNFGAAPIFVALPLIGTLVPVVAKENAFAVPVLLVPLLGAYFAQRALRRSQTETQLTIESLADALELRDQYTHNHSVRVTKYAEQILGELPHLLIGTKKMIIDAARVHDIGKVGVRDAALLKPGKLTEEEFDEIKQHPTIGADLMGNLELYRRSVPIVRHHHERWDGKGYPDGLREDAIPLGARIIAVADAFDAMTSDRPYRRAMTEEVALAEIVRNSGIQFDPEIVDAFVQAQKAPGEVTVKSEKNPFGEMDTPMSPVGAN